MTEGDVRYLKGVGPARAGMLARLGISTREDLLFHVPRSYVDRRVITPIRDLRQGPVYTVSVRVSGVESRRSGSGRKLFRVWVDDDSGTLPLTFFNAGYLLRRLGKGTRILASGTLSPFPGSGFVHPELVFPDQQQDCASVTGVTPVYPLTDGLTQRVLHRLILTVLHDPETGIPELLPRKVLSGMGWESRREVLSSLHEPGSPEEGDRARRALALEELFIHQMVLRQVRRSSDSLSGIPLEHGPGTVEEYVEALSFTPTAAQGRVMAEISSDLSLDRPMRRLLHGDVGSGKTVVAAAACRVCAGAGYRTAIAAPTEVLAAQHARTFERLLEPLGISCALLTGGTSARERRRITDSLSSGGTDVLVGTHAILEDRVSIPDLALCIIDEQHKFGVAQRESLVSGLSPRPHMLIMSATPIPRTLAMTMYGDLDVSLIDEMPPGRGAIETRVMGRQSRGEVYRFLEERLTQGEKAFVVYPLRDESEELEIRDATSAFGILSEGPLGRFGVGLLTGAMSAGEKLEVTGKLLSGEISLLVSTTVIEVGIDVPEATVMIVANAERFGLSQLHQLRGRIGRSDRDAWCFLMKGEECSEAATRRLAVLETTTDGFQVARMDLELRGPGALAGTRQHGLPPFSVASLVTDHDLLAVAVSLADNCEVTPDIQREFQRRFGVIGPPGV